MTARISLINLDRPESSQFLDANIYLETTKVLDRLYGRKLAKLYFTQHFTFDTINITVD